MAEHLVYGASIGAFLAVGSAFGMLAQRIDVVAHSAMAVLRGVGVLRVAAV
jgi:predicted acylesterase/phospholipase RssA